MSVSDWLRSETPAHLRLLSRLREKLELTIDTDVSVDMHGQERATPSREWCRAFARYQEGYHGFLSEERERAKLALLAKRAGQASLTDEEYELEMRELGRQALKELPIADLASEFLERGMSAPIISASDRDDPD